VGRSGYLSDDAASVIQQPLKMLELYGFVLSRFVGRDKVFAQRPDHFIQSSDLLVVRVERSHIRV